MKLKDNQRFVMIGDSVTDAGRARNGDAPSEGLFEPLGKGYPHVISGLLAAVYPELMLRITNVGNSGNNIRNLRDRWQRDVLDLKPDWLSIMIGINDVWRQYDIPQMPECGVPVEEYEEILEELVAKTLPTLSGGMILMTPYYIEPSAEDWMRAKMDEYGAACRRVAERHPEVYFIDIQAEFNAMLKYRHSSFYAWDRVHPNVYGHTRIARAILNVLDFDFNHNM